MKHRVYDDNYDDILMLPHHVSVIRPQMSMRDRAAQFSPFKAMVGYEDAVSETARLTDDMIELDENRIAILNEKLQILNELLNDQPEISLTYFCPDHKKSGGSYKEVTGIVKKIDEYEKVVVMTEGNKIPIERIHDIRGDIFSFMME